MVLQQMVSRGHERVLFVNTPQAGLRAIIAIHDTTLGPGLGGIRRWYYDSEADAVEDVLRLSQAMTYKNAGADLPFGGGKAVIMMNEPGQPFTPKEARAMGDAVRAFAGDYVTAEDVGVNEEFMDYVGERCEFVTGGVKHAAGGGDPSVWTAQGVVNGMKAALRHRGGSGDLAGVVVNVMGLGSVGMHVVRILTENGTIVRGFDINQKRTQLAQKEYNIELRDGDSILSTECDIFAPCALGGVLNSETVSALNCSIVCGAANNPLADPQNDSALLAARGIVYAPDFIVNAGGVIRLAAAWHKWSDDRVHEMIANVENTTLKILDRANSRKITTHQAALDHAMERINKGRVYASAFVDREAQQV